MDNSGIQAKALHFLYKTKIGKKFLKVLVMPSLSKTVGHFMDSKLSLPLIKPFIKHNNINMREYEKCKYKSFNEFFTRKIKSGYRNFSKNSEDLCAPCDAKLTVYKITEDSRFMVKGTLYDMKSLVRSSKLAKHYKGGMLLVFRLGVEDYHRYAYIDNGKQKRNYKIAGVLHTVHPAAGSGFSVYKENTREFSILDSENFGKVFMMEVGAMLVGRITNYNKETYAVRGQEKGRFEYGGSTVILAFTEGKVTIDEEILNNSLYGYETVVKMGSIIGKKRAKNGHSDI